MLPVWLVAFFGAIFMAYTAVDTPKRAVAITEIAADVSATNFLAYRRAVQGYLAANPGITGTADDSSLGPYWLAGYVRDTHWTNVVDGGALYVYSSTRPVANTLDAIHAKSTENLLIGTKDAATGRLKSYKGFDTGIVLPAGIPNNAIVMMGR